MAPPSPNSESVAIQDQVRLSGGSESNKTIETIGATRVRGTICGHIEMACRERKTIHHCEKDQHHL